MEFEYGCQITNKYSFLNESDVEDPSELLAKAAVSESKEAAKSQVSKGAAKSGAKPGDAKSGKAAPGVGKDGKKEPLKTQTDNSSGKPQSAPVSNRRPVGMAPVKTNEPSGPRDGKENTTGNNRGGSGQVAGDRPPRNNDNRRPKPEGGEPRRDNNNPDRQRRPPREGGEGGDSRPIRRPRPQYDGQGGDEGGADERRGPRGAPHGGPRSGAGGQFRRNDNRGPRRTEGGAEGSTREFDRHSGSDKTGVKAVDKKEGAGRGNWGTPEDELAAVEEKNTEENQEQGENPDWATQVEENEESKKEDEEGKESAPVMLTLDEFKKLRQQVDKKNEFNIRKPGEGEDQSKWGKTFLLQKKKDEEEDEEAEEEAQEEETHVDNKKSIINQIQIKFNEPQREKRDRFDRGDRRDGERRFDGERRDGERRFDGERRDPQRQRRPPRTDGQSTSEQTGEQQHASSASTHTDSPNSKPQPRGDRPPQQQNRDRPPRRGPPGNESAAPAGRPQQQHRGPRVHVPKIEDEQDFPSLSKA